MLRRLLSTASAVVLFSALPAIAHANGMSFRAGTTTMPPTECVKDAMITLSEAGYQQNLQILNGQPPNQVATGINAASAIAMIACLQRGDVFLVLHSPGDNADTLMTALALKMNEMMRRH